MFTLPSWILNKWTLRAAAAIAVVLLLLAYGQHRENQGKQIGTDQAGQRTADQSAKDLTAQRDPTAERIAALQLKIDQLEQGRASDRQLFVTLSTQRQSAGAQIQGMTSDQVRDLINQALQRPAGSTEPYTLDDSRKIAGCFSNLDYCDKQLKVKEGEARKASEEIGGHQEKYQELSDYTIGLERDFASLYNATAKPRRSWKCAGLWKCVRPHFDVPDPAKLRRPGSPAPPAVNPKQ